MSSDSQKEQMKRRELLTLGASAALLGAAGVGAAGAIYKYLMPVVSYGTPKRFKIAREDLPEAGDELVFAEQKVVLRRKAEDKVGAISLVCTHLGCTVNVVETGFQCPCHGSQYDVEGTVVGGPAPRTLPWHSIQLLPGDFIEIDTGTGLQENSYFTI
ncbi:MAG: Rieske 2Fe-2S domain-containing protein [Chitinivibrionales bacterium]|nr:Rieske 2Fe-2S domain-containing protein [Chitinivibrionales bacterium]